MKRSLAAKIFLVFVVLLGTFALLALLSGREISVAADDLRMIRDGHLALAGQTAQLGTHHHNRIRYLRRVFDETDPKAQEMILKMGALYNQEQIRATMEEARALCLKRIEDEGELKERTLFYRRVLQDLDELADQHDGFDDLERTLLSRIQNGLPIDTATTAARVEELDARVRGDVFELNGALEDETDRAVQRASQNQREALKRVGITAGVALLLGIFLTFLAQRSLAPITRLVHYARAISRGDYEQPVNIRTQDELAALAEELQRMARSRKDREAELDRQAAELEVAYKRVAELKRYHESVVRSLRTAVVVTDRELVVTSVNRAGETHWGLPAETRGKKLDELSIGERLTAELGPLSELVQKAETLDVKALPLGELFADVTIAPFQNERGDVLGLVLAIEDVTDAVHTKEALIRSERLAAIGRMSAHVTHEIRNPLSSIGLNAEMLQDLIARGKNGHPNGQDEGAVLCSAIVREVDRLTAITDDYLRFARLPRPALEEEDVGSLLSAIGAFMRRDLEAAQVKLELAIEPDLPPVHLDADQMRQAIFNLMRNAKESMPQGGTVVLAARKSDSGVVITVRDSGFGIPKESLSRIFDPFFSTKLTGTGLGLALTQQVVAEHGGRLEVDSTVGVGSEFSILMPHGEAALLETTFGGPGRGPPKALESTGSEAEASG